MLDLDAVIRSAASLVPPPSTVTRLAGLVAREDADPKAVEELIRHDPALTALILRTANSAAWAGRSTIHSVGDAVIRMGFGKVLSLAMSVTVRKNVAVAGAAADAMWRHSVATAIAAEDVRARATVAVPNEAFSAALLHDVGRLVLEQFNDPVLAAAQMEAREADGLTPLEAELDVLGVDHAELGALIASRWNLPTTMVLSIRCHHEPFQAAAHIPEIDPLLDVEAMTSLCCAIHVADHVAWSIDAVGVECEVAALDRAALERLGLTEDDVPAIRDAIVGRLDEVLGALIG